MRIIDSYQDILALLKNMGGDFDKGLWREYIGGISRSLLEKVEAGSKNYDFEKQILPVLRGVMEDRKALEEAHSSFLAVTRGLEEKLAERVGTALEVDIVFYFGLCNGAGWATTLDGKKAVLIGAEKVVELGWCGIDGMTGLIYHELGHIWHDTVGNLYQKADSIREKYVLQLYQEGIAMYIEQLITGDPIHYHQQKGDWLEWCAAHKRELNREYLRRLHANESAQDFFGDWCSYQGYSDVGYFLGCEFVKRLAGEYSLRELANLSLGELYEKFTTYTGEEGEG